MNSNHMLKAAIGIIVVLVLGFFIFRSQVEEAQSPSAAISSQPPVAQNAFSVVPFSADTLVRSDSPVLGDPKAPVTIVEFLDPECEACRAMYPHTKRVLEEFGDKVRLVIRYMPFHQNSMFAANILEGAREQGKYWEAMELLFERQPDWADHGNPRPDLIPEILKPLGLDLKKILKAAEEGKYNERILLDQKDGEEVGVRATPTFFINGHKLESMGFAPLRDAVAKQIEIASPAQ